MVQKLFSFHSRAFLKFIRNYALEKQNNSPLDKGFKPLVQIAQLRKSYL